MLKKFLLFSFFLFALKPLTAQNRDKVMDSLIHVLGAAKEDTIKVSVLNSLSKISRETGDLNKALNYGNEAVSLSEKINFKRGAAIAYNNIGVINVEEGNNAEALKNHLAALKIGTAINDKQIIAGSYHSIGNVYAAQGNYSEALKNYSLTLKIAEEIDDKQGIAHSYGNIGNVYAQLGNYAETLKNNMASLKIKEKIGDKTGMAVTYNHIGNIYNSQGNYAEALKNYSASLKIAEEIGYKQEIVNSYLNIGNIYFQQKNYPDALKSYQTSLKISEENGYKQSISYALGDIGNVYNNEGKYSDALESYLAVLKIGEEINDKHGMATVYINLGGLSIKLNQLQQAKEYLDKGLLLSKEIGSKVEIAEGYSILSQLDSLNGNFKEAYHHQNLYIKVKDSIVNEESNKQISLLKIQYETEKKDVLIKNQGLQNIILQNRIYDSVAVSLIIISIVVLLFYLRNRRKKKEYENKVVGLELKALKSQLSPHFIFNALNSIKLYIDAHPGSGTDYLSRFSLLMRGVLESSEEKEISLGEEMKLMEHYIELEKLRLSNRLNYSITFDESLNKNETMIPPLITQPVIENAIWHGLAARDKSREIIIHSSLVGKMLSITVLNDTSDNGTNSPGPTKRKSFGVKVTRERLALLKQSTGMEGTLSLEIQPNQARAIITIPLQ